jgi:hypothetical protein
MSNNKELIVIILVGIIVLMGVYIITNQTKPPQKQVTFAVPEVSREFVFERDYDYGYLNTPTLFNPSGQTSSPMFFQQMFFQPMEPQATNFQPIQGITDGLSPTETSRQDFRLMNLRSNQPIQDTSINTPVEGISSVEILPHSDIN